MKARQKLSVAQEKLIKQYIEKETAELVEKEARMAAYKMMLIVLYTLRFDFKFKKRLIDFFEAIVSRGGYLEKLKKDEVAVEVYLRDLENSGCDFRGAFDELLEYEEERYKKKRDKEKAIREARAKV